MIKTSLIVKKTIILLVLLLLFVFTRLLIINYALDEIITGEEQPVAVEGLSYINKFLGKDINYRYDIRHGGQYFVAKIFSLLLPIFGNKMIVFKIASFLFACGFFLIFIYTHLRYDDIKTAVLIGIILILGPIYFTKMNLLGYGSHMESLFPIAIFYYYFRKTITKIHSHYLTNRRL